MFSRSSCMGTKPSRKAWTSAGVISWEASFVLDSLATGCGNGTGIFLWLCAIAPRLQSSASRRIFSQNTGCFMKIRHFLFMTVLVLKNREAYHALPAVNDFNKGFLRESRPMSDRYYWNVFCYLRI